MSNIERKQIECWSKEKQLIFNQLTVCFVPTERIVAAIIGRDYLVSHKNCTTDLTLSILRLQRLMTCSNTVTKSWSCAAWMHCCAVLIVSISRSAGNSGMSRAADALTWAPVNQSIKLTSESPNTCKPTQLWQSHTSPLPLQPSLTHSWTVDSRCYTVINLWDMRRCIMPPGLQRRPWWGRGGVHTQTIGNSVME